MMILSRPTEQISWLQNALMRRTLTTTTSLLYGDATDSSGSSHDSLRDYEEDLAYGVHDEYSVCSYDSALKITIDKFNGILEEFSIAQQATQLGGPVGDDDESDVGNEEYEAFPPLNDDDEASITTRNSFQIGEEVYYFVDREGQQIRSKSNPSIQIQLYAAAAVRAGISSSATNLEEEAKFDDQFWDTFNQWALDKFPQIPTVCDHFESEFHHLFFAIDNMNP